MEFNNCIKAVCFLRAQLREAGEDADKDELEVLKKSIFALVHEAEEALLTVRGPNIHQQKWEKEHGF